MAPTVTDGRDKTLRAPHLSPVLLVPRAVPAAPEVRPGVPVGGRFPAVIPGREQEGGEQDPGRREEGAGAGQSSRTPRAGARRKVRLRLPGDVKHFTRLSLSKELCGDLHVLPARFQSRHVPRPQLETFG